MAYASSIDSGNTSRARFPYIHLFATSISHSGDTYKRPGCRQVYRVLYDSSAVQVYSTIWILKALYQLYPLSPLDSIPKILNASSYSLLSFPPIPSNFDSNLTTFCPTPLLIPSPLPISAQNHLPSCHPTNVVALPSFPALAVLPTRCT